MVTTRSRAGAKEPDDAAARGATLNVPPKRGGKKKVAAQPFKAAEKHVETAIEKPVKKPIEKPKAVAPKDTAAKKTVRTTKKEELVEPKLVKTVRAAPRSLTSKSVATTTTTTAAVATRSTRATRARNETVVEPSPLKAPARKPVRRVAAKSKEEPEPVPQPEKPAASPQPLGEYPQYPSTPAHILAPISNRAALSELPQYPTTPAHILAPISNTDALAELPQYPTTPSHIVAPISNAAALAELPQYPTTPGHIKAPISNADAIAELPQYPTTPAHIAVPVSNREALAELPRYPTTPAHILAPVSNAEGFAKLPHYPTTPAHILAPISNADALAELPSYPTTPGHILAPISNVEAIAELPQYPTTPAHILAPIGNANNPTKLPHFPSTPRQILAPPQNTGDITEDITDDITEDITEDIPEGIPEDIAEDITEELTEELTEDLTEVPVASPCTPSVAEVREASPRTPSIAGEIDESIQTPVNYELDEDLSFDLAGTPAVPMDRLEEMVMPEPVGPKSALRSPQKMDAKTPKKTVSWEAPSLDDTEPSMMLYPEKPLRGLVFYVDVTSRGQSQNYLFIDLLEQLGAQTVKQWTDNTKGLTHVLFKDGKMETLKKVYEADGDVKCVNLDWVLNCEKDRRYIPETSQYLVSLSPAKPAKVVVSYTPARTPSKYLLPSDSAPSIPPTPTSSEFNRSMTPEDDKENSGIFFKPEFHNPQRTCPQMKYGRRLLDDSPIKTPSKPNFLKRSPLRPMSTIKRRSADDSFFGISMPPKKLRFD